MLIPLQAIKNVKANAAGLTRANNAKPEAPKPESSTVLSNATSEPSMNLQKAQLSSGLPADFFDNHVTKKQKSGKKKTDIQLKLFFISSILGYGNNYLRLVLVLQHFLLLKTKVITLGLQMWGSTQFSIQSLTEIEKQPITDSEHIF